MDQVAYLQQFYGEDEGLGAGLQGVQVLVTQGVVRVDLGNATAVSLAFQGVLPRTDVPQRLGHQVVQRCVL